MIVQYIPKVNATEELTFDRELWHIHESKEYAIDKGYIQLMFACSSCIHQKTPKLCQHYYRPLVFVPEEDDDYPTRLRINKLTFFSLVIDPEAPLQFATEWIPECGEDPENNVNQCCSEDCSCYYYRSTFVLDMEFIPLRVIHKASKELSPRRTKHEAIPLIGDKEVREAYRKWEWDSRGKDYTEEEFNRKIHKDDVLSKETKLLKKKLEKQMNLKVSANDWSSWPALGDLVERKLQKSLVTNYGKYHQTFDKRESKAVPHKIKHIQTHESTPQFQGSFAYTSDLSSSSPVNSYWFHTVPQATAALPTPQISTTGFDGLLFRSMEIPSLKTPIFQHVLKHGRVTVHFTSDCDTESEEEEEEREENQS